MTDPTRISVIDSHTGGEPTRIIIDGGPDLGTGTLAKRRVIFSKNFDAYRSAVVHEPRGSDVIVGAMLCEPSEPDCAAGVIFFNNVGPLWMCGHGTIGLAVTLYHMNRITLGVHRIDTPVGPVTVEIHDPHTVSIQNVESYRHAAAVSVVVDGVGTVTGDIAWGGNWFFLVSDHGQSLRLENTNHLTDVTLRIREALQSNNITGANGGEIDHIELFGPPADANNDSRSFVLCPGGAYDRSPCGTGTSAKVACLAADGKLAPGQIWKQESIVGSVFEASYQPASQPDRIIPTIKGTAYVNAEATLIVNPEDPFAWGICS